MTQDEALAAETAREDEEQDTSADRALQPYCASLPLDRAAGGLLHPRADQANIPEGLARQLQDPSVLEDTPLYWMRTLASNASEDHYGTMMQTDSLKNYAMDAEAGLPFCNSHRHDELPFGRTYAGRFFQSRGQHLARTEMDAYVPFDMNVNGVDTTHFIRAVRTGVARDVSIQFKPERIMCSIDGRRMPLSLMDLLTADPEDPNSPCRHVPGATYTIDNKRVRALGKVHGAHCLELSPVYRGATPGASILSPSRALIVDERSAPAEWALNSPSLRTAALLAEAEMLDRPTAFQLEEFTRGISFPDVTRRVYAARNDALDDRVVRAAEACVAPRDWTNQQEVEALMPDLARLQTALERDADDKKKKKKGDPDRPPSDDNPDPDNDGDDDRTPEGDSDNSHWDSKGNKKPGKWKKRDASEEQEAMTRAAAAAETTRTTGEPPTEATPPAAAPPAPESSVEEAPPPVRREPETALVGELDPERASVAMPIWHDDVRSALVKAGLASEGFDGDPLAQIEIAGRRLQIEQTWGGWGRRYREELCADIEREGVRAFGPAAWVEAKPAYEGTLRRGDADELIALRKHFEHEAETRGLRGGRATRDTEEPTRPSSNGRGKLPAAAYRS